MSDGINFKSVFNDLKQLFKGKKTKTIGWGAIITAIGMYVSGGIGFVELITAIATASGFLTTKAGIERNHQEVVAKIEQATAPVEEVEVVEAEFVPTDV